MYVCHCCKLDPPAPIIHQDPLSPLGILKYSPTWTLNNDLGPWILLCTCPIEMIQVPHPSLFLAVSTLAPTATAAATSFSSNRHILRASHRRRDACTSSKAQPLPPQLVHAHVELIFGLCMQNHAFWSGSHVESPRGSYLTPPGLPPRKIHAPAD